MEAGQGYRATSIDVAGRQDQSLADTLADVDTGFADVDDRTVLTPALRRLPPRQRTIVHLRFVEGLTQSEIAKRVGLSQMHVSRLLATSLNQLRQAFADDRAQDADLSDDDPSKATDGAQRPVTS